MLSFNRSFYYLIIIIINKPYLKEVFITYLKNTIKKYKAIQGVLRCCNKFLKLRLDYAILQAQE